MKIKVVPCKMNFRALQHVETLIFEYQTLRVLAVEDRSSVHLRHAGARKILVPWMQKGRKLVKWKPFGTVRLNFPLSRSWDSGTLTLPLPEKPSPGTGFSTGSSGHLPQLKIVVQPPTMQINLGRNHKQTTFGQRPQGFACQILRCGAIHYKP